MQEMSMQEIDQVNGGFFPKILKRVLVSLGADYVVDQAMQGKIDYGNYVNSNPNYWIGA